MKLEQAKQGGFDLHWLATLLTGCRETAADVTVAAIASADDPNASFSTWMQAWARRIVIAKALATVREDLARSARRTALRRAEMSEIPPRSWVVDRAITERDLERALLSIDVFPRAVVLLLVFERVPLKDAEILLGSRPELIRTAMAAGLRDLTINLATMQGWKSVRSKSISEGSMSQQRSFRPNLVESIGVWWCKLMHAAPMWPMRGHYRCRTCGRSYAVPWTAGRVAEPVRFWIRQEQRVAKRAA